MSVKQKSIHADDILKTEALNEKIPGNKSENTEHEVTYLNDEENPPFFDDDDVSELASDDFGYRLIALLYIHNSYLPFLMYIRRLFTTLNIILNCILYYLISSFISSKLIDSVMFDTLPKTFFWLLQFLY